MTSLSDQEEFDLGYDIPLFDYYQKKKKDIDAMASTAPQYTFAGTQMAGENVVTCDQCRLLLKESDAKMHSHWHFRVNGG